MAKTNQTRTIDHDEIRTWAEDRGGHPALAGSSRGVTEEGGNLRISFGGDEENLEEVSWDEFFRMFDEQDLALVYEDITSDGELAYTYRLIARTPDGDMGEMMDMGEMGEEM